MHRFYSGQFNLDAGTCELDETETRHLRDVLRIREGEELRVFEGAGHEFLATVVNIAKRSTSLELIREVEPAAPESKLDLTMAVALTKGEKFELVIQKAVELGVTTILPMLSTRCDVRPAGIRKRLERWRRIALDASKQSGRAKLTIIKDLIDFDVLVASGFTGSKVLFSERSGQPFASLKEDRAMLAVVGPEGGWEDHELDEALGTGFNIITFRGRVLRAETAAITIAAVLQHRFGDLN